LRLARNVLGVAVAGTCELLMWQLSVRKRVDKDVFVSPKVGARVSGNKQTGLASLQAWLLMICLFVGSARLCLFLMLRFWFRRTVHAACSGEVCSSAVVESIAAVSVLHMPYEAH
jgi:hypothetical protein